MPELQGIQCQCQKHGPFLGGCDEDQWFLACLHCGRVIKTSESVVRDQLFLQGIIGGQGCPNCGTTEPAKVVLPTHMPLEKAIYHIQYAQCNQCGYQKPMTSKNFKAYMDLLNKGLNS